MKFAASLAALCFAGAAFAQSARAPQGFIPAVEYYAYADGNSRFDFYAKATKLEKQFDMICGDTFCEGDYSNLRSLGLECAINLETKQVGACVWTFAGSYDDVDKNSGKITTVSQVFTCDLGLKGDVKALEGFLTKASRAGRSGYDGLRDVAVPGSDKALMDVLVDCF